MKLFRRKVWKYSKRATILVVVVVVLLLAGGGAVWAGYLGGFGRPTSSSNIDLQKGLIGWWKMNGNAKDSSPYGNDGVLSGIKVVQGPVNAYNGGSATSLSATWPSATTAGDTLVAVLTINNGGTPTAPAGWTLRQGQSGSWGWYIYEINNSASRSGSETFTISSANNVGLSLFELSGVDTTSPDDTTISYSTSSTPSLGPATLGAGAGIAFAVVDSGDGSCNGFGSTTSSGWTNGMSQQREDLEYQLVNGGQAVSAAYTKCTNWKGAIFSFNALAANRPSLTTDREGTANSAYNFNGTNNYIDFGDKTTFDGLRQMSVSTWINPATVPPAGDSSMETIVAKGDYSTVGNNAFYLRIRGTEGIRAGFSDGTNQVTCQTGSLPTVNTWLHITATLQTDGSCRLYLSGQVAAYTQAGTVLSSGIANVTSPLRFGRSSWTTADYFSGIMDNVRIYNRALSANEVAALYNSYSDPVDIANSEKGLVGWWKMDGNTTDSTPYGNNATLSGAALTMDRHGRANSAYSFNGTSNYIKVPVNPLFEGSSGAWALWVKVGALPTANPAEIIGYYRACHDFGLNIALNTNGTVSAHTFAGVDCTTGTNTLTSATSIADGKWHQLVFDYNENGGLISFYIDGNLVGSSGSSSQWRFNLVTSGLRWGYPSDTSQWGGFNGSIDDVRIYDRNLSASEIQQQYNSYNSQISLGGSGQTGSVSLGKGLVGYWPMNGNAKDATPYNDSGTVNGALLVTDRKGRTNSAYSFDGLTRYIQTTDQNNFSPSAVNYNFTLSLWALIPTNAAAIGNGSCGGSGGYMVGKGTTGQFEWGLENDMNNRICWNLFTLTGLGAGSAGTVRSMNDGQWHLYTVTISSSSITLYIDGISAASNSNPKTMSNGTAPVDIGSRDGTTNFMFAGSIDDVRIYNRALSVTEIQALYRTYN